MPVSAFMSGKAPPSSASTESPHAGAFLSLEQLARMLETGAASRAGMVLTLPTGERYALQDGLRILGVEPGKTDPYGLTGRASSLPALLERGFVVSATRVALGRHLYDIELGVILRRIDGSDESGPHSTPPSIAATFPSGTRE